jgi:hypothetical protein
MRAGLGGPGLAAGRVGVGAMRVLVTGGTGFVGAHSVAAPVPQGHQVRLPVADQGHLSIKRPAEKD